MNPMDVYVSADELRAVVGASGADADRLAWAVLLASRYVDYRVGILELDDEGTITPPLDLNVVATTAGRRNATLFAATRFYRSPDVPFGAIGGMGDLAVRVQSLTVPELELALAGQIEAWGVA